MLVLTSGSGPPPIAPRDGREVNAWRDPTGATFARLFSGGAGYWIDWPGVGLFAFRPGANVVRVWTERTTREEILASVFRRAIVPAALQTFPGFQTLHASAVLVDSAVLAFCGSSGQGKSTLAYALSREGGEQWADDALVLDLTKDVSAVGVPFAPRLRSQPADHFAARDPLPVARPPALAPIRACFLLRQSTTVAAPTLDPVDPVAAFTSLLTHAHCFDPHDAAETRRLVDDYVTIAGRVPLFALTYPPALSGLRHLIDAVRRPSGRRVPA